MNIGFDGGYNAIKAVTESRRCTFPSITGTPERARFSLNGQSDELIIAVGDEEYLVGQGAIVQSRFIRRREDRAWISSQEYYLLFLAALTELSQANWVEMAIVTGLPIAYFDDRPALVERLKGEHKIKRDGRKQTFRITDVRVIPQPFGALLSEALDTQGRPVNQMLANGRIGVIDIGGKTTNLLSVDKLSDVSRETASINMGAWDVVRAVREHLTPQNHISDIDLRDHQIVDAIKTRKIKYYGEVIDLSETVEAALEPMAQQIISQAGQLWNGAAHLDAVLITGGGAHLLDKHIMAHYRHARVVGDPVFANAVGYWKLSQRLKK